MLATGDDGIYKLLKSQYGLKQASRCWNTPMNAYLIEKGFKRMEADPCIYMCCCLCVVCVFAKISFFFLPCIYIREVVVDVNGVKKTQ
jgi:Reverse transcriptase (RNA-dependent DNA polymerase)